MRQCWCPISINHHLHLVPSVVREQWIRAKYERKEFVSTLMTAYAGDYLEGILYKRGKEDGKFLPRKFVLSSVEGVLKYYVKEVSAVIE